MPDQLLTTAEVAARLGVKRRQVQALIKRNLLPAARYGRAWLVKESDLAAYRPRPAHRPRKETP